MKTHYVKFDIEKFKDKYVFVPFLKDKYLYKNFNFSVFLDDYCNASCKFCVANIRAKTASRRNIFANNHDGYLDSLDKIFSFLQPYNPTISLSGGEPALFPRIKDVIQLVNKYNFRIRAITTNASHLLTNKKNILQSLIDNNWTYLNLSIPHWDENYIKNIMRYKDGEPQSFIKLLKDISGILQGTALKPRLSCVLLKEGVSDLTRCIRYVNFYEKLGYDNFIFRQLTNFNEKSGDRDIVDYNNNNLIRCHDIWTANERHKLLTFLKYNVGYYYYVEIYKHNKSTVAFEAADLKLRQREMKKHKFNKIFEVVYHPNGNLCSGWDSTKEILLNYKEL